MDHLEINIFHFSSIFAYNNINRFLGEIMMTKEAFVIVDMVNDFVTGKFKNPRAEKIIPNVQQLLAVAHQQNIPVIYCSDSHLPVDHELEVWGEHCMQGTWGAEIIPQLTPQEHDYTLTKHTYCAFFETGLNTLLRELDVDTIVLAGVVTNICIVHTAAAGFFNDYQVIVPPETTDAVNEQLYKTTLDYMKETYHVALTSIKEVAQQWASR